MKTVLVLNGPNLNLLGKREPNLYGKETLVMIEARLRAIAATLSMSIAFFQSNVEGVLLDKIHEAVAQKVKFIIINPGALAHTSVALRDALLAVAIPFIEVHLSNTYQREAFRHHSYLADIALGGIYGLGSAGYDYALRYASQWIIDKDNKN